MPTWAELSTWTKEEIASKVRQLLSNATFRYRLEKDGAFSGEIVENDTTVWEDVQADEKLLLLNAYGWAFTRTPIARSPVWVRGSIKIPVTTQALPTVVSTNDEPEDLSPEEIAAVYKNSK